MKTEITLNKEDLINMIKTNLSHTQNKMEVKQITACVVMTNDTKEDFKEVIFTLET